MAACSTEEAAQESDVIFCAMPHGESQSFMPSLACREELKVIDLGADFRIQDLEAYVASYGKHACHELTKDFTYGLVEAFREQIQVARLVANPGCFATAAQLLLLPLAASKSLPENVGVFAVTGSSGSGVSPKASTHHPFRSDNMFAYKMLSHQHEAEINQTLSKFSERTTRVRLLSHSGPFVRGIHATAYLSDSSFALCDVGRIYRDFYASSLFVRVLDRPPEIGEVAGTNFAHLHVAQRGMEIEILLTLDNLVKGAAGQAIQNMNLMCGFPEGTGLEHPGFFPC
jgi:N-acetyl-gamma-glutamyl-phosphate reductase common form